MSARARGQRSRQLGRVWHDKRASVTGAERGTGAQHCPCSRVRTIKWGRCVDSPAESQDQEHDTQKCRALRERHTAHNRDPMQPRIPLLCATTEKTRALLSALPCALAFVKMGREQPPRVVRRFARSRAVLVRAVLRVKG